MTELVRGLHNIARKHKSSVVTIGTFDGVHIGHKQLIEKVKERAQALHSPSVLITFEPQPQEFLSPKEKTPRLTRFREKFLALAETGVDYVLVLRFDSSFSKWKADQFIERILVDGLAAEHVIVGDDFHFGKKREGNVDFLEKAGEKYGFTVEDMPSVMYENERVSSTRIRQALGANNLALVKHLLDHPYSMIGRVAHGNKVGKKLGFPTANIFLHRSAAPIKGTYAVRIHGIDQKTWLGVAYVGTRPTLDGARCVLEVYIFDFNRDIYGKHIYVEFFKKIREDEKFETVELLVTAIAGDVANARHYFEEIGEK